MKDVVDVILRLLLWDWRETRVDEDVLCLGYTLSCDDIAAGSRQGELVFINAQSGEKMLCTARVDGHVLTSLDISPCGTKIAATSNNFDDKYEIKMFSLYPRSRDGEIQSESTLTGHRYVPSLSRECFLSYFQY